MGQQLTDFLKELFSLGFIHGSYAEVRYTSISGATATLRIFVTGDRLKVVCTDNSGHREHTTGSKLSVSDVVPVFPRWLKKEIGAQGGVRTRMPSKDTEV